MDTVQHQPGTGGFVSMVITNRLYRIQLLELRAVTHRDLRGERGGRKARSSMSVVPAKWLQVVARNQGCSRASLDAMPCRERYFRSKTQLVSTDNLVAGSSVWCRVGSGKQQRPWVCRFTREALTRMSQKHVSRVTTPTDTGRVRCWTHTAPLSPC